jgi:hypothetical protein
MGAKGLRRARLGIKLEPRYSVGAYREKRGD